MSTGSTSMLGSASRPWPIQLIGDSSVCSLADRVYEAPSGYAFLFRTLYVPNLRIADFAGPGGTLGPRVADAIRDVLPPAACDSMPDEAPSDSGAFPPLVISTGFIDLGYVAATITQTDMALPEALLRAPSTPPICRTAAPGALDAAHAVARYAAAVEPLRVGLRQLRALGFARLGVLGLSPPTRDDAYLNRALAQARLPSLPRLSHTAFRYKGTLLANAALARICTDEGVPFVERWSGLVEQDGLVRPEVLHDFLHLTPDAAQHSALAIASALTERDRPPLLDRPDAGNALPGSAAVHDAVWFGLGDPHTGILHGLANAHGVATEPGAVDDEQLAITEPYAPPRVLRGQRFFAEVTLGNGSATALVSFGPNPIRFAPIWLDASGRRVNGDAAREPVAPAARPGASTRYAILVTPPDEPGRYTLRVGLVQELVRWYSAAADVVVTVL